MPFLEPSSASTFAFLAILLAVLASICFGVYYASERLGKPPMAITLRTGIGIFLWLWIFSLPVANGFLEASPLPRVPLFLLTANAIGVGFALSPIGKRLALGLPLCALVAFQAFRLPLELVLHSWVAQGTIPETMTWTGKNLDILSGIVALIVAPFAGKRPQLAWFANTVGFVLLLNVIRVAIFSSPLPFAWDVEPKLVLAFHLPYAWIVPVCVAGALAGHIVLTRALFARNPG